MKQTVSACAFCGHPDARHRTIDAIAERVESGEPLAEVLEDYGYTEADYERVSAEVALKEGT